MYLAAHPAGRATIGEIAAAHAISLNHLTKVVHFLGREGYLANTRGRGGGIRLARAAETINLGELVHCAEGGDVPAECFENPAGHCPIMADCRLAGALSAAVDAFYASLRGHTLADVTRNREALARILIVAGPARAQAAPRAPAQASRRRRKSTSAKAKLPPP